MCHCHGVDCGRDGNECLGFGPEARADERACDGSRECQAERHILGCFASSREQTALEAAVRGGDGAA